jgi:hypothetical protein
MGSFGFPLAVPGSANAKNRAPITCAHAQGMQRVGLPLAVSGLVNAKGQAPIDLYPAYGMQKVGPASVNKRF